MAVCPSDQGDSEKKSPPDHVDVPGGPPDREYRGISLKPKTGEKCAGCGQCARSFLRGRNRHVY